MTPTRKKNGIAIEAMYTASYVAGSDVAKIGSIALGIVKFLDKR